LNPESESFVVRRQLNDSAIAMWLHSPIFGVGLGNYLVNLPEYLVKHEVYYLQPVHSIYLLLLTEVGIVGVGLLVLIILYLLNSEFGIVNSEKKHTSIYSVNQKRTSLFPIPYSLFALLILGLFDHYPLSLQQGQILTTVIISLNFLKFVEYSISVTNNE
jgi:O-antigen ligase